MVHYSRIEVLEDINFNKSRTSKEFIICHFDIFLLKALGFNNWSAMGVTMY